MHGKIFIDKRRYPDIIFLAMSAQLPQVKFVRATEIDPQEIIDFWKRNSITVTPTDRKSTRLNSSHYS